MCWPSFLAFPLAASLNFNLLSFTGIIVNKTVLPKQLDIINLGNNEAWFGPNKTEETDEMIKTGNEYADVENYCKCV